MIMAFILFTFTINEDNFYIPSRKADFINSLYFISYILYPEKILCGIFWVCFFIVLFQLFLEKIYLINNISLPVSISFLFSSFLQELLFLAQWIFRIFFIDNIAYFSQYSFQTYVAADVYFFLQIIPAYSVEHSLIFR